ncbi:MAG: phosphoserine phosphatase [Patescibacteria group bacterium]|nr:phosphoserine phosphatase [Patescibacteria group bacterium]
MKKSVVTSSKKSESSILTNPYTFKKPKITGPYTSIYLIRHCHPAYELQEKLGDLRMPLSSIGLHQRGFLTKKLLTLNIDKIYVSQFMRSKETAQPLAEATGLRPITDRRLNEINWQNWYRVKYLKMSDKTRVRSIAKYRQMENELDKTQVLARRLLADIYEKNKNKKVAVFCHGNLIRSMLTGILNTDVIGFLSMEIYQSSISKLVIDTDGYVKINYINNIGHLPHRPDEDLFMASINQ